MFSHASIPGYIARIGMRQGNSMWRIGVFVRKTFQCVIFLYLFQRHKMAIPGMQITESTGHSIEVATGPNCRNPDVYCRGGTALEYRLPTNVNDCIPL
jgi:hypothetical protein